MIADSSESFAHGGPKVSGHTCSQLQYGWITHAAHHRQAQDKHGQDRSVIAGRHRTSMGKTDTPTTHHGEQWVSGRMRHSALAAHGHQLA
jgi:hypothetical protein